VSDHHHYHHYDPALIERLDGAWGRVDEWLNREIMARLPAEGRVLELGCGFGSLTAALRERGRPAVGMDLLASWLGAGARRRPGTRLVRGDGTRLPFAPGSIQSVVLKDALHHLVAEAPVDEILAELRRIDVQRVVVVDPNPMPALRLGRRLIGHVDPECSAQLARALLERHGYGVESLEYGVLASLPLSGGYVGPVLLPGWPRLWSPLLRLEGGLCRWLDRAGLASQLCWRYFLVASR
jgi:SAM-dependent methyltransferase